MIYFTKPIETMDGRPARYGGLNPDGTRTISHQGNAFGGWFCGMYSPQLADANFRNVPPPPAKPLECEVAWANPLTGPSGGVIAVDSYDHRELLEGQGYHIQAADRGAGEGGKVSNGHCIDCCCARSWKALGITEYTGKSIPEHIAMLCNRLALLERLIAEHNEKCRSDCKLPPQGPCPRRGPDRPHTCLPCPTHYMIEVPK